MFTQDPTVQIHPTRFCNLRCLHCYSSSSPDEKGGLPAAAILQTTEHLADEGYARAALSGGEPLLYDEIETLIEGLVAQGFIVSAVSNGTRGDQLKALLNAKMIHHAAISFDGLPSLHDDIRQRRGAFALADRTLRDIASTGAAVGGVLSVTQQSLLEIPELVARLVEAGARFIQLHPIAASGRAVISAKDIGPELDEEALLRVILMAGVLQHQYPKVAITCDALMGQTFQRLDLPQLGQQISPIVLRSDGAVLPFSYDFSSSFSLGCVGGEIITTCVTYELLKCIRHAQRFSRGKIVTNPYRNIVNSSRSMWENL